MTKMTSAAKMNEKSMKTHFCRRFFMEMTPPGLKKVSEGRPRGHPATLRQAFLGLDGSSYADLVGLQSHSEALRCLTVLQEALRGAPGHHFYIIFLKIWYDFQSFLVSLFDASLDHRFEQTIQPATHKTQRHMATDTHAHKTHTSHTVLDVRGSFHRGVGRGVNPLPLGKGKGFVGL